MQKNHRHHYELLGIETMLNFNPDKLVIPNTIDKKIEFMQFLYSQGFSTSEIGKVYNIDSGVVEHYLDYRLKKAKRIQK